MDVLINRWENPFTICTHITSQGILYLTILFANFYPNAAEKIIIIFRTDF